MKDILDHENQSVQDKYPTYSVKAFLCFKWVAVFFTAGLIVVYLHALKGETNPAIGLYTLILWGISFLLSIPCLFLSIMSLVKKEGWSYRNVIGIIMSCFMIVFVLFGIQYFFLGNSSISIHFNF